MIKYEDCIKLAKEKYENDYLNIYSAINEAIEFFYSSEELGDLFRMFDMTRDDFIEYLKRRVCEKD